MKRYEVHVRVVYKLDAESEEDARRKVDEGAEFPMYPFDDNTYCDAADVIEVKELPSANISTDSDSELF